jgi:hypothetical protein
MPRLVINPGTPQAWEIQLKPGLNFLGRGASNDFKLDDLSISGSHCQIMVDNGAAVIKDMGSTNGTYVNRAKIQESRLESGQPLRLGSLDMIFYTDGPDAVSTVQVPAPPPPPRPGGSIRVAGLSRASEPTSSPTAVDAPPMPPALDTADPIAPSGPRYCKFHPKAPARYLCNKCNRTFCELCVTSRNTGAKVIKICRSCGVECVPVQFKRAATKSFYAGLPGAFIYPFKGAGIIILICATVAFAALDFVRFGSLIGIFTTVSIYGFIFLFMQNIIHTTTSDEEEDIGFPDVSSLGGAAFQLGMTILAAFWLPILLELLKIFEVVDVPVEAIMASFILSGIYFPMAFLAVAMKDSVMAANPLVVIPAIMKVPVQYGITVILLLLVFGVRQGGTMLSSSAGHDILTTKDMSTLYTAFGIKAVVGLVGVYLLIVTMRILGLFYNSSKDKLGWFSR